MEGKLSLDSASDEFFFYETHYSHQGLSQDLETGCLKLAIVKFLGVQILKGDHNIFRFHP